MKKTLLILSAIVLFFAGCKKDDILEEGEVLYKFAVTTNNITDIKSTTAQCGGDVSLTSVDGLKVTARGVCWSTKPNPTINDNKTSDGSGTGNFTSNLINLTDNTTYYVRAYATNEKGTSYGEEKSFKTKGIINGYEWVDLGLPSGLKWATCNVGASSPEDYGDYYAWGETETKTEYTQYNSLTYKLTKSELKLQGYIDGSDNLTPSHDAATANWGGSWRMPTGAELEELKNICTWTWITQNGVKGYNVTGPNGNSIFLPAAGRRNVSSLYNAGVYGYYWSSATNDYYNDFNAYNLYFEDGFEGVNLINRYRGHTVRPVSGENKIQLPTVTTNDVTNITSSSATCGGNVTFDGGFDITARGVCWGTKPNPTINDNKTNDGNGTGSFTSNLTNLTENTTYYVRAYATTEKGMSYGEEKSFKTLDTPTINGYEYVDLGLPSGLKWATCNVGASSPEDYGNYYAWGETETKTEYTQDNSLTYGLSVSGLQSQGYIDGSGNLAPSHDAARANWGSSWRMPTKEEQQELIDNCNWTWTTQNGVKGCKVTGPNGNHIFLPAAGVRDGTSLYHDGGGGYYWSSSPDDNDLGRAYFLYFCYSSELVNVNLRYGGQTVRPITE